MKRESEIGNQDQDCPTFPSSDLKRETAEDWGRFFELELAPLRLSPNPRARYKLRVFASRRADVPERKAMLLKRYACATVTAIMLVGSGTAATAQDLPSYMEPITGRTASSPADTATMLASMTRIVGDRSAGALFWGNYDLMNFELMGGDARAAIIAESTKRGTTPFLPPVVPWNSRQWPMLVTPGRGPASLADLP